MDLKNEIDGIVNKLKADPSLLSQFKSDPAGTIKKITGISGIDSSSLNAAVAAVKAKLSGVDAGQIAGDLKSGNVKSAADAIKKLL